MAGSVTSASFSTELAYKPEATQDLVNFAIEIKQNGNAEITISSRTRFLRHLAKMADLRNPEQVKAILTTYPTWNKQTRRRNAETYDALLRFLNISWKKPNFIPENRLPFIPTEAEIDQLIASCGNITPAKGSNPGSYAYPINSSTWQTNYHELKKPYSQQT